MIIFNCFEIEIENNLNSTNLMLVEYHDSDD